MMHVRVHAQKYFSLISFVGVQAAYHLTEYKVFLLLVPLEKASGAD
jgi:hypothetical protein